MYNAFSQSLMKKYGWNEGDGLGKNNQGITQPIKATLKFNSHGLAYKEIDTEQDSKWSNMFSSAVSNLKVENGNQITVTKNDTKEEKLNLSGVNVLYKSFLKSTAVLKDGVEIKEKKPKKAKRKLDDFETTSEPNVKKCKVESESDLIYRMTSSIIESVDKIKKKKKSKTKTDEVINSENQSNKNSKTKKSKKRNETEIKNNDAQFSNEDNQKSKKKTKSDKLIKDKSIPLISEFEPQKSKKRDKKKKSEKINKKDLTNKQSIVIPDSTFLTCHTSARCGITMSGKLARIQKLHEDEKLKNQTKSLF